MLDIDLKEIYPGDIVIMTRGSGVFKAEFVRETKCQLYFKGVPTKTNQRAFIFYINKGSSRDNVYKV